MDQHKEELATLESLDSGAVYTLALKTHIGMSVDTFRYFAGWCDKIQVLNNKIYGSDWKQSFSGSSEILVDSTSLHH